MRQNVKSWEALGISRATWYRYGKPTDKAVYEDLKWEKGGPGSGTLADAEYDLKNHFGFGSIRTFQRVTRVMKSELWPYVDQRLMSVAEADRTLSSPYLLRLFREKVARIRLAQDVQNALKLFEQERRNDISAEAIASYLDKSVETIIEVLRLLDRATK